MATATHSESRKSKSSKSHASSGVTKSGRASTQPDDAVSALMEDHRKVKDLFKEYEKAKEDEGRKQEIYKQIHMELKVHTQVEEEIFYPASREFVKEEETVNESMVEHASAKDLMAHIEQTRPDDPYYDARVKVLQEMIEHHVEEEETELFPECRKSDMDLKGIGEQIKARKAELMGKADGRSGRSAH